jgi:hypothetical protein
MSFYAHPRAERQETYTVEIVLFGLSVVCFSIPTTDYWYKIYLILDSLTTLF